MMRYALASVVLAFAAVGSAAAPPTGPLSPRERRVFDGEPCDGYRNALADAMKLKEPEATEEVMASLARPEVVPDAQWQACVVLANRDRAAYQARMVEGEAVRLIATFGEAMAQAFERTGQLCGSTHAVPASVTLVAKGAYGPKDGDWDQTWDCVGNPLLNAQRFQYEIKVDQKKRSFVITARGYPAGDAKLRTLTRTGRVEGKTVKLGELQRK